MSKISGFFLVGFVALNGVLTPLSSVFAADKPVRYFIRLSSLFLAQKHYVVGPNSIWPEIQFDPKNHKSSEGLLRIGEDLEVPSFQPHPVVTESLNVPAWAIHDGKLSFVFRLRADFVLFHSETFVEQPVELDLSKLEFNEQNQAITPPVLLFDEGGTAQFRVEKID